MNAEKRRELDSKIEQAAKTLAPIFERNEWKWDLGDKAHVPSEGEIKNTLFDLAYHARHSLEETGKDHTRVSTGRLAVGYYFGSWQIDLNMETVFE